MVLYARTESGAVLWDGPYSAFSTWRNAIALAAGYDLIEEPGAYGRTMTYAELDWDAITDENNQGDWDDLPEDPLVILFAHADHEGHLHPDHAALIADRLEAVAPGLQHVPHGMYWMEERTRKAIAALRQAAEKRETVEFS